MGQLVYTAIASLDGYINDREGNFDWAMPDPEVHAFINDLERACGTHLYGRRLYEVMQAWETFGIDDGEPPEIVEYGAIWRALDKLVYSRTLEAVTTTRTQLRRDFDPAEVRALKATSDRDLAIGGPHLAAEAFAAGLIDRCNFFLAPIAVGAGTPMLLTHTPIHLELIEERRFPSGFVYLNYRTQS